MKIVDGALDGRNLKYVVDLILFNALCVGSFVEVNLPQLVVVVAVTCHYYFFVELDLDSIFVEEDFTSAVAQLS